jgi:hypothetical protein
LSRTLRATACQSEWRGSAEPGSTICVFGGSLTALPLRRYLEEGRRHSPHGLRAIVPVHLYGLAAAMREIQKIVAYARNP